MLDLPEQLPQLVYDLFEMIGLDCYAGGILATLGDVVRLIKDYDSVGEADVEVLANAAID